MSRPIAFGRVVATVAFISLATLCVWAWMSARGYEIELTTQPASMEVDLSRLGVTEGPYVQSTPLPHAEGIWLDLASDAEDVNGLKGKLTVLDAARTVQSQLSRRSMTVAVQPMRATGY